MIVVEHLREIAQDLIDNPYSNLALNDYTNACSNPHAMLLLLARLERLETVAVAARAKVVGAEADDALLLALKALEEDGHVK